VAAQILYDSPGDGRARRRGTDFYEESIFLWLDVDTLLRERSRGRVTLDDFCRRFYGGANSGPTLIPYSRADVVKALNDLVPYDWERVIAEHVDRVQPRLPVAGLERAGWRLAYGDPPNQAISDNESRRNNHDWRFSLGFTVGKTDEIGDVLPDSPAGRAGMVAGEKLLGVGGHVYSARAVETALTAAKSGKEPIEVIAADGDAIRVYRLDYHGGPRYPHLERIDGRPDVLSEILRARGK
jgi:predicted metalloprotease with PDZ domain